MMDDPLTAWLSEFDQVADYLLAIGVDNAAARIVGAEGNTTSAVRGLQGKFAS